MVFPSASRTKVALFATLGAVGCATPQSDTATAESKQSQAGMFLHGQLRHAKPSQDSHPAGAHRQYFDGRVVSNIQVVQLLYGTESYIPQVTSTSTPSMATSYQGVLNSPYVDWLTEYNTVGQPPPTSNQVLDRGSFSQQVQINPGSAALRRRSCRDVQRFQKRQPRRRAVRKPASHARDRRGLRRTRHASMILFLAANPVRFPVLQLNEECRAIERMLAIAKYRDQIRFRSCWAVRLDDLVQALNDDTPAVLHFSGHGYGTQGICLQGEDGSASLVCTDELVELMQAAGDGVTAVVLNACYTEVQARALASCVPCVVGTSGAIGDNAAIAYSRSLYRGLASGRTVANAHQQGTHAFKRAQATGPSRDVVTLGVSHSNVTNLLTRSGVDAHRICIAGPQYQNACTRYKIDIEQQLRDRPSGANP